MKEDLPRGKQLRATTEVSARPPQRAPQESRDRYRPLGKPRKFPGLNCFTRRHIRLLRIGQGSSSHFNRHSRNYTLEPRLCEISRSCCIRPQKEVSVQAQKRGGVLASTHRWKRRRHAEDGSLASLKTGPKNKRRQRRSRSRGLIDRDVCRGTPATAANVDSRLANRWSDRANSCIDFVDAREPDVGRRMAWL